MRKCAVCFDVSSQNHILFNHKQEFEFESEISDKNNNLTNAQIFEKSSWKKSSWKNQVGKIKFDKSSSTNWISSLFPTGRFLPMYPAKINFDIDFSGKKSSLSNLIFQTFHRLIFMYPTFLTYPSPLDF